MVPIGLTNIGSGIAAGNVALTDFPPAREDSIAVAVLLTDGCPNRLSNSGCDTVTCNGCWRARDEAMARADEPAELGLVYYTISTGSIAWDNRDLMKYIADVTDNGVFDNDYSDVSGEQHWYYAPTGDELQQVFADIADQIYVRRVQ